MQGILLPSMQRKAQFIITHGKCNRRSQSRSISCVPCKEQQIRNTSGILGTEKIRYPIVEQLNACTIGL
jgi:hypothetical protein